VAAKSKHIPMPPELDAKLVSDLEAGLRPSRRIGRRSRDPVARRPLPSTGDEEDVRRVVRSYGEGFRVAAEKASPLLAMAWLERSIILTAASGSAQKRRDRGGSSRARSGRREGDEGGLNLDRDPAVEIERLLNAMTAGTIDGVLFRIAIQFIPDKTAATQEVHRLANTSPLSAIISQALMDREGRPRSPRSDRLRSKTISTAGRSGRRRSICGSRPHGP
jgi:hypothetical protein